MCIMSINPLKEFFKRRKAEAKFARAGPGKTLASETGAGPSRDQNPPARQAAAEAAMKRFSKDTHKPAQRPRISTEPASGSNITNTKNDDPTTSTLPAEGTIQKRELLVIDGVAQRDVRVYSTEELAQRIKTPEIDDEFFRLTVDDAKLIQQRYNEERTRNEILRTSEMRRRDAEAKKSTTNIARLRFRLPNNFVLEASFSGTESMGLVRDWLVATCVDKMELDLKSFDILMGLKPIKEADFERTVKQLGLIPATTLSVVLKNA
uniref:UBX domain-containing protein 6 n=1 Tax=Aceria tosichella TaxID=561515 RepID=A0A6G1S9C1_9ACAR